MRKKLSISISDLNKHNRISRSYDEKEESDYTDICDDVVERVVCYNDDSPSCSETTTISGMRD